MKKIRPTISYQQGKKWIYLLFILSMLWALTILAIKIYYDEFSSEESMIKTLRLPSMIAYGGALVTLVYRRIGLINNLEAINDEYEEDKASALRANKIAINAFSAILLGTSISYFWDIIKA
ncbi:hypothetical protein [Entomospira culicis]|uniref:Uncharacterized protein n=1 Tax=Entomospira culicis TaxID=2719989 RepID=A0A968L049_9SPIO|nr:hypothetical protein [Entomospira culicis]NIZ19752.1 hypothetical protein [Entomospira culicis]NIZ69966.1 hypothetical protein [Entomospira culicis]WDI37071.1 hypothetical protein PVA46_07055 [Entomospira culicis]WDI38700.1 hypothetical protein PVA47_07065 [Entomospira culicis]